MDKTNRDFDQDDAEVLAGFAKDVIILDKEDEGNGVLIKYVGEHYSHTETFFYPWLMQSGYWQIQSLLDVVREKGLEEEFYNEFRSVMYEWTGEEPTIASCGGMGRNQLSYDYDSIMMLFEAPPEAICEAILSLEDE